MKKCFKCEVVKPLDQFYKHPQMADGHLNKCKDCNKKDTKQHTARMKLNPEWVERDLERHRIHQAERRRLGTVTQLTDEKRREVHRKHALKYPEKHYARTILGNAVRDGRILKQPCVTCGSWDSEAHHEDYSKPLAVIWFCSKHHAKRHIEMRRQKRAQLAEQKKIAIIDLEE